MINNNISYMGEIMGFGSWFKKKEQLSSAEINNLIADLLFGMVAIDAEAGKKEIDTVVSILSKKSGMNESQLRHRAANLKRISKHEHEQIAESLRDNLGPQQLVEVLRDLWAIAMADGVVHRYEEAMFNRTAIMLGISGHGQKGKKLFIKDYIKTEEAAPQSESEEEKSNLSEAEKNVLIADLLLGMVMVDADASEKEIDRLIYILSGRNGVDETQLRQRAINPNNFSREQYEITADILREKLNPNELERVLNDLQLIASADADIGVNEKEIIDRTSVLLGISS